jgi:hypothetical protein
MAEFFLMAWMLIPSGMSADPETEEALNKMGLRLLLATSQSVGPFKGEPACVNAQKMLGLMGEKAKIVVLSACVPASIAKLEVQPKEKK